jgi:glyoxylase-like metal-dependent hydrolase (beta-lactamase superfamily II)
MLDIDLYCGGICATNAYFLPASGILIDAPEGVADWLKDKGYTVQTLLLTHGHFDHVWDGARITEEYGCQVLCHPETTPMITDGEFFAKFGLPFQTEPFSPTGELSEANSATLVGGVSMQILEIPGHCPGSLAFYLPEHAIVFAGDTLLASGICRTDLPGGDGRLLLRMIREKLYTLPDQTRLLAGHGDVSTIGIEKETNPYVRPSEQPLG